MAERTARRFGSPAHLAWILSEQAVQAYHHADWATADRLLAEVDIGSPVEEVGVAFTSGRLSAARGQLDAALIDATAAVSFTRSQSNYEYLCGAFALEALSRHSNREAPKSMSACQDFLEAWTSAHDSSARAMELCEVGSILAAAGAHAQLNEAASRLPGTCRWREALLAHRRRTLRRRRPTLHTDRQPTTRGRCAPVRRRQAADQGRTAEAHRHAEAVIEFAEQTGASRIGSAPRR